MLGPFHQTLTALARGSSRDYLRHTLRPKLRQIVRKRLPYLHPKHGPRNYYKGNRARSLGRHTTKGKYIIDWKEKVPEYVVPDLKGCDLKPYVSHRTPLIKVPPPPMPDDDVMELGK